MTLVIYEGPQESGSITADGQTFTALRGESVDVPAAVAVALPPGWVLQVPAFQLPASVESGVQGAGTVLARPVVYDPVDLITTAADAVVLEVSIYDNGDAGISGNDAVGATVTNNFTAWLPVHDYTEGEYVSSVGSAWVAQSDFTSASTWADDADNWFDLGAFTLAPLAVDGITVTPGQRILVNTDTSWVGIYVATAVGSDSEPWLLTRSSDCDTGAALGTVFVTASGPLGATLANCVALSVPQPETPRGYSAENDELTFNVSAGVPWDENYPASAEGLGTVALGVGSHAEGRNTLASGESSHAEGLNTVASGVNGCHAEGVGSQATSSNDHAEGESCIASGGKSHAEGSECVSSGVDSHAEGDTSISSGEISHAQGHFCQALGYASDAMGDHAIAPANNGAHAHAAWWRATAGDAQYVRQPLQTPNAAPGDGGGGGGGAYSLGLPASRTMRIKGELIARENTGADSAVWDVSAAITTNSDNVGTDLVAATVTKVIATSGASAWSVTFVDGVLTFSQGADGRTVTSMAIVEWWELG